MKPPRWQNLSPDQQSELETAVGGLDPTLVEQAYSAARVPSAWLTLTRQRVSRIWRALPAKAKWALPVAAAAVVAGAVILLAVPALSARIGGILAGLGGLAGITAIWRTVNDQVCEAHKRFTDIKATIGDTVERWQAPVQIALDVSEKNVATLERELQELTAAGQLAGFVADRAAAGNYRASLGLMTQVRQDFQAMSQLLTKDSAERASGQLEGLDDVDAGGDTVPRIDRIVLYIDDLDRCPPQRVVEMLEAVHLLLAVPLFVVIVAVDPRWLLRAIGLHYREILTSTSTADPNETPTPADPADDDYWASTPAQYLEKIFQLVFTLPPMSPSGYTALLDDLIGPRADLDVAEVASTLFDHRPATDSSDAAAPSLAQPDVSPAVDEDEDVHDDVDAPVTLSPAPIEDRVDPLALNSAELTLIRFLGPPLITTPRAVKRLANSYGLLASDSPAHPPRRRDRRHATGDGAAGGADRISQPRTATADPLTPALNRRPRPSMDDIHRRTAARRCTGTVQRTRSTTNRSGGRSMANTRTRPAKHQPTGMRRGDRSAGRDSALGEVDCPSWPVVVSRRQRRGAAGSHSPVDAHPGGSSQHCTALSTVAEGSPEPRCPPDSGQFNRHMTTSIAGSFNTVRSKIASWECIPLNIGTVKW